jgi:transposase
MLWWLKSGQVSQQLEIGKRLGRDTSTVTRWLQKYRRGGLKKLLEIKTAPGNPRKIPPDVLSDLQQQLQQPEGFPSYGAILEWLQEEHNLTIEYAMVYGTLRYLLGAKLRCPAPRAIDTIRKRPSRLKKPRSHTRCPSPRAEPH